MTNIILITAERNFVNENKTNYSELVQVLCVLWVIINEDRNSELSDGSKAIYKCVPIPYLSYQTLCITTALTFALETMLYNFY